MVTNILVALDNSEFAEKVMAQAVELAKFHKAKLTGLSVVDYSVMTFIDANGVVLMPELMDSMRDSYERMLKKCETLAKQAGVEYKWEIVNGSPAGQIVDYAADNGMDLIILGHIGRSAAAQFMLGSVANKVVNYSKCSVLIVK